MLHKMQTGRWTTFKAHLTSHPVSFYHRPTIFSRFLYHVKHPIRGQRKTNRDKPPYKSPPSPLPLSLLNKHDPVDCEIIRLVKKKVLSIGVVKIK